MQLWCCPNKHSVHGVASVISCFPTISCAWGHLCHSLFPHHKLCLESPLPFLEIVFFSPLQLLLILWCTMSVRLVALLVLPYYLMTSLGCHMTGIYGTLRGGTLVKDYQIACATCSVCSFVKVHSLLWGL